MNRKGKIARLPQEIRQELNTRLSNGETGASLAAWLNGLPEVQAILASDFGGMPITEDNLSEWRRGGYLDWLNTEDACEVVEQLQEGGAEFQEDEKEEKADLGKAMEYYLSSRQALETKKARMVEGKEKWALWKRMCLEVVRLRQSELQSEKLELAEERLNWKEEIETQIHAEAPAQRAWEAKSRARAAAKRRGEFTEEELEEGKAESDAIFKSETEEQAEYYRKLRWEAEDADALAAGKRLPDHDYEVVDFNPESPYGPGTKHHYHKTPQAWERERKATREALRRGERGPKPKPYWSPTGFAEDGDPIQEWEWPRPRTAAEIAETADSPPTAEAAVAGGQPAAPAPAPEVPPEPARAVDPVADYIRRHPRPPGWRPPLRPMQFR